MHALPRCSENCSYYCNEYDRPDKSGDKRPEDQEKYQEGRRNRSNDNAGQKKFETLPCAQAERFLRITSGYPPREENLELAVQSVCQRLYACWPAVEHFLTVLFLLSSNLLPGQSVAYTDNSPTLSHSRRLKRLDVRSRRWSNLQYLPSLARRMLRVLSRRLIG